MTLFGFYIFRQPLQTVPGFPIKLGMTIGDLVPARMV
jgi:hypothetical protein